MATVDDRDLAVGRIYGKAMLDLAEQQGEADALLDELGELVKYLDAHPEFENFLATPLVEEDERAAALEKIFRGRASDLLVDSLQVINRKGRLGLLRAVAEAYKLEYRDLRGIVDVTVRTAVPLTDAQRARLDEAMARFTGKKPLLTERVDPSILGGLVIEAAGQKIDTSVATRLRELSAALERRASQEILRSRAYISEQLSE
jgi:F-type H+-transporting ATPase subunit delta